MLAEHDDLIGRAWSFSTRSTPAPATHGTTALGTGERVPKHELRIAAYGTVDETNAAIGMARVHLGNALPGLDAMLARIQNDLFDLGADLCVPDGDGRKGKHEPAARQRSAGGAARGRDRRAERRAAAAALLRAAGRLAGVRRAACRAHRVPPRRAADGRACGAAGRGRRASRRCTTSTACRISCSSPAATPMTAARATSCGCRDRTGSGQVI